MNNCLYFICPTDFLEPTINNYNLTDVNYYYTSLGNSVSFNKETITAITKLIKTKQIDTIRFVLSIDNPILLDALEDQQFNKISGLHKFYAKIVSDNSYQLIAKKEIIQMLTSHLIQQVNAFQSQFKGSFLDNIKIESKIYDRKSNTFRVIYNKYFLWRTHFSLN